MPIYEYSCRECGVEFEKLVGARVTVACPSCESSRVTRRISLVGVKTAGRFSSTPAATQGGGCCGGGCGCH
ncbi:MAG TPA: zinc ribbon domain-containing protein [Methylomirabilota bacterium]|jgi:putative FmdB family regulatory protein|nr:zinc ribbon domain-containing protein [Methylomirabilota bacterium]